MRFAAVWMALVFLAAPGIVSKAAAQEAGEVPVSECEQARRDWAANETSTPPDDLNDRLAWRQRSSDTEELRYDLDCDHRLSFDEYVSLQWEAWRRMDADADEAVSQAEYVTEWYSHRLGGLLEENPDWRANCERTSASNFQGYLGARRPGGIDERAYRYTVRTLVSPGGQKPRSLSDAHATFGPLLRVKVRVRSRPRLHPIR